MFDGDLNIKVYAYKPLSKVPLRHRLNNWWNLRKLTDTQRQKLRELEIEMDRRFFFGE